MFCLKKASRKTSLVLSFLLLVSSTFFGQQKTTANEFTISGTVTGFTDGTWMYLSDLSDGSYKLKDSALVQDGKFRFAGSLPASAVKFSLHTGDLTDRISLWIENAEIIFAAAKGDFKNAVIQGSKAQMKRRELDSMVRDSKDRKADYIRFIQNNPATIVSADLLNVYSSTWNKDTVSMLYQGLSTDVKNTLYGKNVLDFLTLNKNPRIGDRFVDFEQANPDGKMVKLSDFSGKVVLLEFWGSWCLPCRQSHPELIKTYREFKEKGFEILGVAADVNKEYFIKAITEDGLPWPNVSDLKGDRNKAALIYGVSYYPTNFLIDRNGVIIGRDLKGEKLNEKLRTLLQ